MKATYYRVNADGDSRKIITSPNECIKLHFEIDEKRYFDIFLDAENEIYALFMFLHGGHNDNFDSMNLSFALDDLIDMVKNKGEVA